MSKLIFRVVLAAALIATVASKIGRSPAVEFDVRAAVVDVIARNGGTPHAEAPSVQSELAQPMYFDVPSCDGPLQVIPVRLNLQESPLFSLVVLTGYSRSFVYLNKVWLDADRLGLRAEWIKQRALSMLGLGRYVTDAIALLVAAPPGCKFGETIDWSPVWYLDRLSNTQSQPSRQAN
jgi:hypothetical protein